jgi:phosphate:Na+ symporter
MSRKRHTRTFGSADIGGLTFLIDLAGAVALLLWGVRMVRTGVSRALGGSLRLALARCGGNSLSAFATGLGVTAILQSSTATVLLLSAFVERGMLALPAAIAAALGADLGTTFVAQALSVRPTWLAPLAVFVGFVIFARAGSGRARHLGRAAIGVGLMLLALHLLVDASAPLRASPVFAEVLGALSDQPFILLLAGAGATWLASSSIAMILLVMSLAGARAIPMDAALALVLGINLGGPLTTLTATLDGVEGRRVAVANLVFRAVGAVLLLPFVGEAARLLAMLEADPARQVVNAHTAFNAILAIACLPFVATAARLVTRAMPAPPALADDPGRPRHLHPADAETPAVALTAAARETMRMADMVETMLREAVPALVADDRRLIGQIEDREELVDRLHEAIKLYVTDILRADPDPEETRRATEILSFTTNLEHIGDIIDKGLMELADKKIKHHLRFSAEGLSEIQKLHARVADNLRLAMGVFMSGDPRLARQLLAEKVVIREMERRAAENHHARLTAGRVESIASSALHLDVIRDLKRIHSHICSVAYPVLEARGEIVASRLGAAQAGSASQEPSAG